MSDHEMTGESLHAVSYHAMPCDIGRQETICALKKVLKMNPILFVVGWIVNVIEWKADVNF